MARTLTASRVVAGEPAVAALLITAPDAAGLLPHTSLTAAEPGQLAGSLELADGSRPLVVMTAPPRRTPTAYIAHFRVHIEGAPAAAGTLHVMAAGPTQSEVVFSLTAQEDMPAELDGVFDDVINGFFDNLERVASGQAPAA